MSNPRLQGIASFVVYGSTVFAIAVTSIIAYLTVTAEYDQADLMIYVLLLVAVTLFSLGLAVDYWNKIHRKKDNV